jgi:hypothetical protein
MANAWHMLAAQREKNIETAPPNDPPSPVNEPPPPLDEPPKPPPANEPPAPQHRRRTIGLAEPRIGVRTLCGSCQRIHEEHLDRVALFKTVTASPGVEIAALFKLIELALRY